MSHDHPMHGDCEGHDNESQGNQHDAVAGPGDEIVICTVRGNTTVKPQAKEAGLVRVHEGARYYVCCGHCAELFDADPLAYSTVA